MLYYRYIRTQIFRFSIVCLRFHLAFLLQYDNDNDFHLPWMWTIIGGVLLINYLKEKIHVLVIFYGFQFNTHYSNGVNHMDRKL